MDENLHDIDKLFRDPIEEYEDMPSVRVWDAIDANLDKSNIVSIKKKYNNLKKIAIVLLLLLLGAVVYEVQTKKTGGKNIAINTGSKENTASTESSNNSPYKPSDIKGDHTPARQPVNWSDSSANNFTVNNATKNPDDKTATKQYNTINKTKKEKAVVQDGGTRAEEDKVSVIKTADKINKRNKPEQTGEEDAMTTAGRTVDTRKEKKSSIAKTKIRVQNGTAADITDGGADQQADDNDEKATAAHDLIKPEFTPVEKIASSSWDNSSRLKQIAGERLSPDAKLKKSIRMPNPFHFSLTPFISPQFSFNRMEDDHHDPGPQPRNNREQIKKEEQHQRSISLGILADMPLGKKWGLQSGIIYVSQETLIEPKKIFAKLDADGKVKYRFDCSSGYTYISLKTGTAAAPVVGDSVTAAASSNTLRYIGIPLALNYTINLGKFSLVPTFGAVANFLVKQRIETEIVQPGSNEKQTINSIQGLKSSYFNAYSGIAFEYNLNKKVAFSVMPAGNFAISAINKDAAVKSYPNSFALTGGVKIKF